MLRELVGPRQTTGGAVHPSCTLSGKYDMWITLLRSSASALVQTQYASQKEASVVDTNIPRRTHWHLLSGIYIYICVYRNYEVQTYTGVEAPCYASCPPPKGLRHN